MKQQTKFKQTEDKINWNLIFFSFLIMIIIGVLTSLNSYGCLVYNKINVLSPWHFPSCCWDSISHILGDFLVLALPGLLLYSIFIFLESRKIMLNGIKNYFIIAYILIISYLILKNEVVYELSKPKFNFSILIYDFIGIVAGCLFIFLIKNKLIAKAKKDGRWLG